MTTFIRSFSQQDQHHETRVTCCCFFSTKSG